MASSKVMMASSTSPSHHDLPRQQQHQQQSPSIQHSLSLADIQGGEGSMNMDEILRNIYTEDDAAANNKSVDEVWKEIVAGSAGNREPEMTLEDFLTKAGAVTEDDVRIPDPATLSAAQFQVSTVGYGVESVGFGNGIEGAIVVVGNGGGGGGGRGKRRAVEEVPVDKATQQKQRRMIKNRESAARSRERKQAYTVELESLVTQLEEENSRLLREEAEQSKERLKQLMENLIPVVEQRKQPRSLRRIHSMSW